MDADTCLYSIMPVHVYRQQLLMQEARPSCSSNSNSNSSPTVWHTASGGFQQQCMRVGK